MRVGLPVTPLEVLHDTFKGFCVKMPLPLPVKVKFDLLRTGAVEKNIFYPLRQLIIGGIDIKFLVV